MQDSRTSEATPSVSITKQVMFFDTDCAAVMHNIAYLRFIEEARTLLAGELGWELSGMADSGLYPVVVRTEVDYKRPAKLGDELVIHGRLESIERMRFWCSFTIERPADSTLHVSCRQSLALIQAPEMKLVRLPIDWPDKYPDLYRKKS